ncbi:MAG: hypothetical protein ACYCZF_13225 [Anaerolineae bacterium]
MEQPHANVSSTTDGSITWRCDIPLLTNPFIMGTLVAVFCISIAIMEGAVALASFLFSDELVLLPPKVLLVVFGVILFLLIAACLIMGNRLHLGFILNTRGATQVSYYKTTTALKVTAGIAAVLGAWSALGLLTSKDSRQEQAIPWRSVKKVIVYRSLRAITLSNGYFPLLQIYCPPDEFDTILAFVKAHTLAAKRPYTKSAMQHPYKWWFYAGLGALVLLATLATQAWYWASYDNTQKIGIVTGVITLVVVASWALWASVLIAVLSALCSLWFLGQTLFAALEPFKGGVTYMLDPWELALSVCGGLILLGVAVGRWLDTRQSRATKNAG